MYQDRNGILISHRTQEEIETATKVVVIQQNSEQSDEQKVKSFLRPYYEGAVSALMMIIVPLLLGIGMAAEPEIAKEHIDALSERFSQLKDTVDRKVDYVRGNRAKVAELEEMIFELEQENYRLVHETPPVEVVKWRRYCDEEQGKDKKSKPKFRKRKAKPTVVVHTQPIDLYEDMGRVIPGTRAGSVYPGAMMESSEESSSSPENYAQLY